MLPRALASRQVSVKGSATIFMGAIAQQGPSPRAVQCPTRNSPSCVYLCHLEIPDQGLSAHGRCRNLPFRERPVLPPDGNAAAVGHVARFGFELGQLPAPWRHQRALLGRAQYGTGATCTLHSTAPAGRHCLALAVRRRASTHACVLGKGLLGAGPQYPISYTHVTTHCPDLQPCVIVSHLPRPWMSGHSSEHPL